MSRRDGLEWRLTDEELPDLFDMAVQPSSTPAANVVGSDPDSVDLDLDNSSFFAQEIATNIANTLSGEFDALVRPERASKPSAPRPRDTGGRKVPPRRNPPPLPSAHAKSAKLDGGGGVRHSAKGAASTVIEEFRVQQDEEEMFALEKTTIIETSLFSEGDPNPSG